MSLIEHQFNAVYSAPKHKMIKMLNIFDTDIVLSAFDLPDELDDKEDSIGIFPRIFNSKKGIYATINWVPNLQPALYQITKNLRSIAFMISMVGVEEGSLFNISDTTKYSFGIGMAGRRYMLAHIVK